MTMQGVPVVNEELNLVQESSDELKDHYVYELRDPVDKKIFYVGKGSGRRLDHHENEAINNSDRETGKLEMIRKIQAEGRIPDKVVIARFNTEAEAFAVEAVLIHWVYGHPEQQNHTTLTNIKSGHGSAFIRPRDDFGDISDIDVNRERSKDGAFTDKKIRKNEKHGVQDKLEALRDFVVNSHPEWSISEVDMTHPMSPLIFIEVGGVAKIQCILPGTGAYKLKIVIRAADSSKVAIENFRGLVEELGNKTYGIKNPNYPYCRLDGFEVKVDVSHTDEILRRLEHAWNLINQAKDALQLKADGRQ